jgi:hypothetical protein
VGHWNKDAECRDDKTDQPGFNRLLHSEFTAEVFDLNRAITVLIAACNSNRLSKYL